MAEGMTVGMRAEQQASTVIPLDHRRSARERGSVTAEAAAVIPVLIALALGLTWLVALAATQVRVVDAAREAARFAARGESDGEAVGQGARVAPGGTRFSITRGGSQVEVTASVEVRGPGGLFSFLPGVTVASHAVAAQEPR